MNQYMSYSKKEKTNDVLNTNSIATIKVRYIAHIFEFLKCLRIDSNAVFAEKNRYWSCPKEILSPPNSGF